jgi:hypothetical protein
MSFKRFEADDLVVSAEPVSAPVWSTNTPILSTFFTSSTQPTSTSGNYYLDIYQTGSQLNGSEVQLAIAYGDAAGLGTAPYNSAVPGYSPTKTVYGQYRTLVLGDEESSFKFGGSITSDYFYAISIDRDRYRESLLPGTFNLTLTNGANTLKLTDNSAATSTIQFNDAGRVFEVVSGSNGIPATVVNSTGFTLASGSYGFFLPDIGTILLSGLALSGSAAQGGIGLSINRGTTALAVTATNAAKLYDAIKTGAAFQLNYQETVSSQFVFTRVRNSEFNYSTNPSYITGSGDLRISNMVNAPQSYITSVGMYNDNNELLAVAKLSRPLLKDFTKEALIRIKLDF